MALNIIHVHNTRSYTGKLCANYYLLLSTHVGTAMIFAVLTILAYLSVFSFPCQTFRNVNDDDSCNAHTHKKKNTLCMCVDVVYEHFVLFPEETCSRRKLPDLTRGIF